MADVNIEKIVIGFLEANKASGWAVYGDMPDERPTKFILVDRTGGPRENIVQDRAEILIEVYHKDSRSDASDEANRVSDILKNLESLEPVMRAKTTSLVRLDDLINQYHRYQIYCDIFYRRDVSAEGIIYPVVPTGGAEWGSILGVLSNQTDLQTALDSKYDVTNPDGFISDISGFDTDDLAEGSTNHYSKWQADSPGIIYPGHIAVGADADVNGTGPFNSYLQDLFGSGTVQSPLLLQETATGTPSFYNIGLGVKYGANFTGNVAGLIGNENTTTVVSGNSSDVTIAIGHYNTFVHRGTGTISTIYGQADGVHNQSTGTITTAYAMFAQAATNTGGGSIGTVHGLLVEPQTVASNNYGVTIGGASTNTLWLDNTADSTTASKGIVFGVSKDTNLYRSAAGRLKTDSRFDVAGAQITLVGSTTALRQTASNNANNDLLTAIVSGDSNYRLQMLTSGAITWGSGSSTGDTNLYRSAANTLKTDDSLVVTSDISAATASGSFLASTSDTNTGTATNKVVTPDGLAGSVIGTKNISIQVIDAATTLTTGDGKAYFRVPAELNGMNIVGVAASVLAKSTSGTPTVQIARGRQSNATTAHSFVDVLSTAITIDANEFDSKDATTAAVINTSNDDLATGDLIRVDVDTAGTGTTGLFVTISARLP